ncbi:MAG: hypothetical protein ACI90V_008742, partial [Bacillariaceae sp.]
AGVPPLYYIEGLVYNIDLPFSSSLKDFEKMNR